MKIVLHQWPKAEWARGKPVPPDGKTHTAFCYNFSKWCCFIWQTKQKILEYSWEKETSCSDCSSAVAMTSSGGWKFELRIPIQWTNQHFTYNARACIGEDEKHPPHNMLEHYVWTCFWLFWTKNNRNPPSPRLWRTAVRKDPLRPGHSSKAPSVGIVSRHNTTADALKVLIHYLETPLGTHIPADGNQSRNVMC